MDAANKLDRQSPYALGEALTTDTITAVLHGALAERRGLVAGYLFGSFARDRARPDSDVDVAVLLDAESDRTTAPTYRLELATRVASRLGRPVDVVILNDAALVLRNQVLTYGRLVVEADRQQRIAYEVLSRQLYWDFRPILDRITAALKRHIQEGTFGQGRLRPVIETRLAMLSEHVSDLRALRATTFEQYADNRILRGYVERTLQVCVQICLDVGSHLTAELGLRPPADSHDVFVLLNEEGIVSNDLLPDIARMVGFRNLIVHDYARIDDGLVYAVLQEHLDDFTRFAGSVYAFLNTLG